jgi:hypothetical protein
MSSTQEADHEINAFTIVCGDGETVSVAENDAVKVFKACDYFRNVFAHNTKESQTRVVQKPDWTSQTASYVIRLLASNASYVPLKHAYDVVVAFDQLLVTEYEVCYPRFVTGDGHLRKDDLMRVQQTLNTEVQLLWTVDVSDAMQADLWIKLLSVGCVVLDRSQSDVPFKVLESNKSNTNEGSTAKSNPQHEIILELGLAVELANSLIDNFKPFGMGQYTLEVHSSSSALTEASLVTHLSSVIFPMYTMPTYSHSQQASASIRFPVTGILVFWPSRVQELFLLSLAVAVLSTRLTALDTS